MVVAHEDHNIDEREIIGPLLAGEEDDQAIGFINHVLDAARPEYFTQKVHREILLGAQALRADGQPVSLTTLARSAEDGQAAFGQYSAILDATDYVPSAGRDPAVLVDRLRERYEYRLSQAQEQGSSVDLRMLSLADYLRRPMTPTPHILPRLGLRPGGAMVLAASGGDGKSLAMQSGAVDLSYGNLLWDYFEAEPQQRVALFFLEDPESELRDRFTKILGERDPEGSFLWVFDRENFPFRLGDRGGTPNTEGFAQLDRILAKFQITIAMFDPLIYLHDAKENDNVEMMRFLGPLRDLGRKHHTAIIINHHMTWGSDGDPHERGATAIRNWADTVLHLRRVGDNPHADQRKLTVAKINYARPFDPLVLTIDPLSLRVTATPEGVLCKPEELITYIREDLEGGWHGTMDVFYGKVAAHFHCSVATVRVSWEQVKKAITVEDLGRGKGFRLG